MITITINTDSAAFDGEEASQLEIGRILMSVNGYDGEKLHDINGNTVGEVTIT